MLNLKALMETMSEGELLERLREELKKDLAATPPLSFLGEKVEHPNLGLCEVRFVSMTDAYLTNAKGFSVSVKLNTLVRDDALGHPLSHDTQKP